MPPPHSLTRRLAERFALVALSLYHLPLFLNNYPSLGGGSGGFSEGLAVSWGHIFTRPGIWLARILFGMTGPMTMASAGDNGDVGEEYARLILSVAIGVVIAGVWTTADRQRPRASWVAPTSGIAGAWGMRWTLAGTTLRLDGTLDGARVSMDARRLDDKDYPLVRGGVHVIYDRP